MLLNAIQLPDDLQWVDEFDWTSVAQDFEYGTTGALFIQESVKLAGRPITLVGQDDMAWITRETVISLHTLSTTADQEMTLTLSDARTFTVRFRQGEKPIDVISVKDFDGLVAGSWFKVNAIRLVEV